MDYYAPYNLPEDSRQDSMIVPELGATIPMALIGPAIDKISNVGANPSRLYKFLKFGTQNLGSALGMNAMIALTGNNYWDKASLPQVGAVMAGNMIGGHVGEALARGAARALAARAGGALAGATAGSVIPGIGTVTGALLGGWLLPKFFDNAVERREKGDTTLGTASALGATAAAAAALTPYGRPLRRLIANTEVAKSIAGSPMAESIRRGQARVRDLVLDKGGPLGEAYRQYRTDTMPVVANARQYITDPNSKFKFGEAWEDTKARASAINQFLDNLGYSTAKWASPSTASAG